jgi:hypothetical protein
MGFGVPSLGVAAGAADVDVAGSPSVGLSHIAAVAVAATADAAADVELASGAEKSVLSKFDDRLFDLLVKRSNLDYIVGQKIIMKQGEK